MQPSTLPKPIYRPRVFLASLALLLVASAFGCTGGSPLATTVDGYVALVPRILRAGETASMAVSLFNGDALAAGDVHITLRDRSKKSVAEGEARIDGKGTISVDVPRVSPGDYEVVVTGPGFVKAAQVKIQEGTLLFLETDKPSTNPARPSSSGWWPSTPN